MLRCFGALHLNQDDEGSEDAGLGGDGEEAGEGGRAGLEEGEAAASAAERW